MSRLDEGAKKSLITMQYFTDKYKEIIRERDKSFYDKNKSELDNFAYVIKRYTGYEYWFLNNFLREGKIEGFNEKELKSWAYCLHSSLQFRTSNVKNGTVVYRGVSIPAPKDWKVGNRFYFGEFVSITNKKLNWFLKIFIWFFNKSISLYGGSINTNTLLFLICLNTSFQLILFTLIFSA